MARVHVAVGVLRNTAGEILISLRAPDAHQGNLWEFPGGKVEPGEAVEVALAREFREELGIEIGPARAFVEIAHDYVDKAVLLDVWLIDSFSGIPEGLEGQALVWCPPGDLGHYEFPAANVPIVEACRRLRQD